MTDTIAEIQGKGKGEREKTHISAKHMAGN